MGTAAQQAISRTVSRQAAREAIDAQLARLSLHDFVRQAWHVIEPATPFSDNWHIQGICEHLEAVTRGDIRNLLINMPPRCAKSTIVSVMWPCWVWIQHPDRRWMFSSYALSLAIRDSVKCRRLIESPWYQRHFGDAFQLADDQNAKSRFENDRRGYRLAMSVGSGVTGEGGDAVVVDDPHNVKTADSEAIREATLEWWDQAMSTRLNNPKTGAKVIVMQRVHDGDLSGHVLQQGGYEHLMLPMEYEPSQAHVTAIGWTDPRREDGELLWPSRIGPTEVATLKRTLGPYGYAGQCQQRPTPREGGFLKREWLGQRYRAVAPLTRLIQAVDSAFKAGVSTDYSVIATWGASETPGAQGYHLLHVWRERVAYPELIRAIKDQHAAASSRFGRAVEAILVEDKGSGQSAIQTLRAETKLPIIGVPAVGSKEARFDDVTPLFQSGRIWLPDDSLLAPWLDDWIDEHIHFPRGAHDDTVDTSAYALAYLRDRGNHLAGLQRRADLRRDALRAAQLGLPTTSLAHPGQSSETPAAADATDGTETPTPAAAPTSDGFAWPW